MAGRTAITASTSTTRVKPPRPDLVAKAIVPDYALGPHTASLGLASSTRHQLARRLSATGMFVGQHGSWNRKPRSGYKVIFVPFADGKPSGPPIDVLTGFVDARAATRTGGRSASRSTARARCSSPTTSATRSGA